jgi:hypothetical protein
MPDPKKLDYQTAFRELVREARNTRSCTSGSECHPCTAIRNRTLAGACAIRDMSGGTGDPTIQETCSAESRILDILLKEYGYVE